MWEKSKLNINEEETKVRKNLGRLIHTLQHFPCTRSGFTSSLWNLIEELESFNSDQKPNPVHFSQTAHRKTYSKKYFNLHIADDNGKTLGQGSDEKYQKLRNYKPHQKSGDISCYKNSAQMKEKGSQRSKMTKTYSLESQKPKTNSNTMTKINNTLLNENVTGINQEPSTNKYSDISKKRQIKPENTTKNKNTSNKLKEAENKIDKNTNLFCKKSKINHLKELNCSQKPSNKPATKDKKRSFKTVRNPMGNFKYKSHQCTPKSNEALQQIILGDNQAVMDKRSVVKKLTSYWNNLLNNEFEQKSSITGSSGGSCQSFHILNRSTKRNFNRSETESKNNSSIMKSRHLSESNINIMKRVEDLQFKYLLNVAHNATREQTSKNDSLSSNSKKNRNEEYTEFEKLDNKKGSYINQNCGLPFAQTKDVIEVLQNTINGLQTFPNCEIDPLTKKMLYIIVASSTLEPLHHDFLQKIEFHADKMIEEILELKENIDNGKINKRISEMGDNIAVGNMLSAFKNNLDIDMEYIVGDKKKSRTDSSIMIQSDPYQIAPLESRNSLALLTPRINLSAVENALNFFLMWKEFIWSNNYGKFGSFSKSPYQSFTIIYEEDIFIEEESYDEDDSTKDDTESENRSNRFMFRSVTSKIEKYVDRLIDILENYLTNSPEEFIRVLYQALVSILVWWVLVREIFIE